MSQSLYERDHTNEFDLSSFDVQNEFLSLTIDLTEDLEALYSFPTADEFDYPSKELAEEPEVIVQQNEEVEPVDATSEGPNLKRNLKVTLGTYAAMTAVVIGFDANPAQKPEEIQISVASISSEKIAQDLNSGDRTSKPVPIMNGYELIIPKESPEDPAMSIIDPIDLGNNTYGAFVFDKKGNAKVIEVKSVAEPMPIKEGKNDTTEGSEIVYPVSVVYTKDGKDKVFSVVAGEDSGNSAETLDIKDKLENSEQKQLLKDKKLKNLAKALFSTAVQDRVGYLNYIQ